MKTTIEESQSSLRLIIEIKQVNIFAKILLFALTAISIIAPINIIFFLGINAETIIGLAIFIILAVYFGRLYLWNSRGKETIEISDQEIIQTLDYGLFKNTFTMKNNKIVLQINDQNQTPDKTEGILDLESSLNEESNLLTFANDENESIHVNGKLSPLEIKAIKGKLNF